MYIKFKATLYIVQANLKLAANDTQLFCCNTKYESIFYNTKSQTILLKTLIKIRNNNTFRVGILVELWSNLLNVSLVLLYVSVIVIKQKYSQSLKIIFW